MLNLVDDLEVDGVVSVHCQTAKRGGSRIVIPTPKMKAGRNRVRFEEGRGSKETEVPGQGLKTSLGLQAGCDPTLTFISEVSLEHSCVPASCISVAAFAL